MDRWANKVALVTATSTGIGRAIAEQLVHHGVIVVGIDRHVDKMKILAEEWKLKNGKLIPLPCDMANGSEVVKAMEWIEKNIGVVEILVNNAIIDMTMSIIDGNVDDWKKCMNVNLMSVIILIREMHRILKKKDLNSGIIINVNDMRAWSMDKCERPTSTGISMTLKVLRGLTENLRMELARMHSNIKVISVIPGLVDTDMTEKTMKDKPRLALKPKDVADVVIMAIQTSDTVLIQDLVVKPIREVIM